MRKLTLVDDGGGDAHTDADAPDAPPRTSADDDFARGDHVELASRMLAEIRNGGETLAAEGAVYVYSDKSGLFSAFPREEQSRIVQSFAGLKRLTEEGKTSPLRVKKHDVTGAIDLARDQVARPDFFTNAPAGIAFADCFVALDNKTLAPRAHSQENRARFAYSFNYTPGAVPTRLLAFLGECFAGCDDAVQRIQCVQEYTGSALVGIVTRWERALVLHGEKGANGKSTLSRTIEHAMPVGSCVAIPPQQWGDQYRLAMLAGKRLNIVAELPESDILAGDAFKSVISGDATTGREIRQSPFGFRPIAGHVFSANTLPGTVDQTGAFWRRITVIGFPHSVPIERQDPTLAEQLCSETPAIVAWLLEGARAAIARGRLTTPESSREAVAAWQQRADQVRGFLAERTKPLPTTAEPLEGIKGAQLYRAYRNWANESGHKALSSTSFGLRLKQVGIDKRHTRLGVLYDLELCDAEEGL